MSIIASEADKEIRVNLILVSSICNFTSFLCGCLMLRRMLRDYSNAKSNTEKRRLQLYKYTLLFTATFIAMILCLEIVPFVPITQAGLDFTLQVLLFIQIIIYTNQWKENI